MILWAINGTKNKVFVNARPPHSAADMCCEVNFDIANFPHNASLEQFA